MGAVALGVLAKNGLKYSAKSAIKTIRHPSSIPGGKKALGAIAVPLALAGIVVATSNTVEASPQTDVENKSNDNLWFGKIAYLFATGNAKLQIVSGSASDRHDLPLADKIFMAATLIGLPVSLYKAYKYFCKNHTLPEIKKPTRGNPKRFLAKYKFTTAPYKKTQISKQHLNKMFNTYKDRVEKYRVAKKKYDSEMEALRENAKKQKMAGHLKGFGGNLLWSLGMDLLSGDPDKSFAQRIGGDFVSAGAGYIAEIGLTILASRIPGGGMLVKSAKSALPAVGSIVAMSLADTGMDMFFGNNKDEESLANQKKTVKGNMTEAEIEKQSQIMESIADSLGVSNEVFMRSVRTSLFSHGIDMSSISAYEQKIWQDKLIEFMGIYGDIVQALNAASQSLANIRSAIANLKTNNGKNLPNAKLVKAADGSVTLDDSSKYTIFSEVQEQWKNDDKTKGSWYQRRAGDLQGNAGKLYNDISNYYYHTNDDNYFKDRANNFHAMANSDDEEDKAYYYFMNSEWGRWRSSFVGTNGNRFDSATIGGAEDYEVKNFLKWEAEQHYNKEYEQYWNTVGSEEIEDKVKEIQSAENTRVNSSNDYLGGGEGGFDMNYMHKYESSPGATDLEHVNPKVASAMNAVSKEFYEQTGKKITITGGAELGPHAGGTAPGTHGGGAKVDISRDMSSDEEDLLGHLIAQHGGVAGREDSAHLDVSFYRLQGLGGSPIEVPDKFLLTGEDGRGGGDGSNTNPLPKVNASALKLNLDKIKPKTLSEQVSDNSKRFNKAMESMGVASGKTVQGKIVNGMYVDTGSKFQSIDDVKKLLKEKEQSINKGTVTKDGEMTKENLKAINERTKAELEQHPEEIVKKNWVYRDILAKVEDIVNEYMMNPLITSNVNYK
jgi:arsenate reductase-like glutaredoxin family protein